MNNIGVPCDEELCELVYKKLDQCLVRHGGMASVLILEKGWLEDIYKLDPEDKPSESRAKITLVFGGFETTKVWLSFRQINSPEQSVCGRRNPIVAYQVTMGLKSYGYCGHADWDRTYMDSFDGDCNLTECSLKRAISNISPLCQICQQCSCRGKFRVTRGRCSKAMVLIPLFGKDLTSIIAEQLADLCE